METYLWRGLLVIGAAVAASAQHSLDQGLTFDHVAWHIVRAYNQLEPRPSAFGLVKADGPPEWDPKGEGDPQELQVTIKETNCSPDEKVPSDECDIIDDGVKKFCSGMYTAEQGYHFIMAQCGDTETTPGPMLRSRWKEMQKKLIKRFRASGRDYALAVTVNEA